MASVHCHVAITSFTWECVRDEYGLKNNYFIHCCLIFQAPQPPQSWQGTLDATQHGPVCPQYDINMRQYIKGDENCLFLNVYTKSLQSNSKLPVMVYIHGGGFLSGSGDSNFLGPQYFLQHDVLLVTLNYRLEILGFLNLDIPEVPGNAGLKDQLAALTWVKHNIQNFGGDPDNITLFGESAGGSSVTYHLQNPRTEGLFHKAITQSGVSLAEWAQGTDGKTRAFKIGKALGKDTNDTSELLEFLCGVPAIKLTKMTMNVLSNDERHRGLPLHFVPVVEKKFENVEPFITEDPLSAMLQGKLRKVPLIIGYNSAEGLTVLGDQLKKKDFYNKNPQYLIPREVAKRLSENQLKEFGDRVKKFYVGSGEFGPENLESIANVNTDILFIYNINRFLNLYSQHNKDVFVYKFDTVTELNIVKQMSGFPRANGMCHADDLFYFFHSIVTSDLYEEQERLRDIVFRVTKLWVDFAKNR